MNISDFQTNRFTFELRFQDSFLIWDRSGALTTSLRREFPTLEVIEGTPAKISLVVRPNIELVLEINKAFIIVHKPKRTAEDLSLYSIALTKIVTETLEISRFKRIGTRLLYQKSYPSIHEATEKLTSFGVIALPEKKFFNQHGSPKQGAINFVWEGETTGARVRLATDTENFEFIPAPPHADRVDAISKTEHFLYADIDIFSTKEVLKEQGGFKFEVQF